MGIPNSSFAVLRLVEYKKDSDLDALDTENYPKHINFSNKRSLRESKADTVWFGIWRNKYPRAVRICLSRQLFFHVERTRDSHRKFIWSYLGLDSVS